MKIIISFPRVFRVGASVLGRIFAIFTRMSRADRVSRIGNETKVINQFSHSGNDITDRTQTSVSVSALLRFTYTQAGALSTLVVSYNQQTRNGSAHGTHITYCSRIARRGLRDPPSTFVNIIAYTSRISPSFVEFFEPK